MKKVILATALVSTLAFSSVQAAPGVPQQDLNQVFSMTDAQQNQFSKLSVKEMKETEGEWFWYVVMAAVAIAQVTSDPGQSPSRPRGAPSWGGVGAGNLS